MTQTERIDTNKYALLISDGVKKTFALFEPGTQFNKAGFTSSKHGFLGWTGMILNAILEGLTGEEITEGKMKGKIGIAIPDVETFERVVSRLRAFQEANPRPERGQRTERAEKPVDPRTKLANRIVGATKHLADLKQVNKDKRWGMDLSSSEQTLGDLIKAAKKAQLDTTMDVNAIGVEIDAYVASLDRAVVENKSERAAKWIERIGEGMEKSDAYQMRVDIQAILDKHEQSGNTREADDAFRVVFDRLSAIGRIAKAESYEPPEREPRSNRGNRGGSGAPRGGYRSPGGESASIGEQIAAKASRSRR